MNHLPVIATCTLSEHGADILSIFNHEIEHSHALYDTQARDLAFMQRWFEHKHAHQFPVLGAFNAEHQLLGFASFDFFRSQSAFQTSAEHSIYVHHQHRGQGLGKRLLEAIIHAAAEHGRHCLIGVIDSQNTASIHLHEQFGFVGCGQLQHVAHKHGQWLDVCFYQKTLASTRPQR